ncbi:S1 family peptidase [Yinghuangia soli]|uniref:S1 family peptidase n=1 Tax=Yinghuangia soli TaxID=2908204 RepID=A0AA41U0P4_9ACTN|nr:S1 family peptidase [Yinghuangia soli]MCF2528811.1 S1 family peptidase [Yinghuangia soli]
MLPTTRVASRRAADAIGRGPRADIFSGVDNDPASWKVTLYLTDPSRAGEFVAAMRALDPGVDMTPLTVAQGKNTRLEAKAEAVRLVEATDLPFQVFGASWLSDGSAVKIQVDRPAAVEEYRNSAAASARSATAPAGGKFGLIAEQGSAPVPTASRVSDTSPFYGAAAIGVHPDNPAAAWCTTGIPVVDRNGGRWITTAAHCTSPNAHLYTHLNGYIGQATIWNPNYDVAFINANSYPRTWDGLDPGGYTRDLLGGAGHSQLGEEVCHLGYNSMVIHQRIPCGNRVVTKEHVYRLGSYTMTGVLARQYNFSPAAVTGDSGVPVVSFGPGESRIVRGFVSAVIDGREVIYQDFTDIAGAFSVRV